MRILIAAAIAGLMATAAANVTPGPQPDGSELLHNQWSLRPVGVQVPLGEFPAALAVHPDGGYAAVLHSGYGPHEIWVVDLQTQKTVSVTRVKMSFDGLAFTPDGTRLLCSGGTGKVLYVYGFDQGRLAAQGEIPVPVAARVAAVSGVAAGHDNHSAFVSLLFAGAVARLDLDGRKAAWVSYLDPREPRARDTIGADVAIAPNSEFMSKLQTGSQPFGLIEDPRRHRVYVALWGESAVAVLDANDGRVLARWPVGLHPNQFALSRDGRRLFVANGGGTGVTVLDPSTGACVESLRSTYRAGDPPGATPDALALDSIHQRLYVANGYADNVAVFDVSRAGHAEALGFIPTGWEPFALGLTPGSAQLLVVSARGLSAHANAALSSGYDPHYPHIRIVTVRPGPGQKPGSFPYIADLYEGTLGIVDLPRRAARFTDQLRFWTEQAALCRPQPPPPQRHARLPLRYVIYIIKENRTYDEVFGDLPQGNGDPALCLFPRSTTPNLHQLATQFVLLDNFYANAEVSTSGHEWSTAGYSSEFIERIWPVNYGHREASMPYPGEGNFAAAVPALGYLWDRAAAAHVSYRDYGEFVHGTATPQDPSDSNLPALKGHVDPLYRGWSLDYSDVNRADRFIAELHRMERTGDMPRLQILRLPNDHTAAGRAGALSPRAYAAQNDYAVGRLVEAVSHSRFWPQTAIFIVEDDAQNGPDHVDAHRTEALVISPYVKHGYVDSTPYTTCSMLATMEHILGLPPMSLFDAVATPMDESFDDLADLAPYRALPPEVSLLERNPAKTKAAAAAAHFDFSKEDLIEDQAFNRAIWMAMRGDEAVMPAPVHAAFVRAFKAGDDDDDD
ncbi:MAG TPA: alkaline phosphatase family protein [Opitutaceae bacterium]|jgi:DNA-binding beta-propeller fold protein YncE|nr:alkaline phosphatase family protein [Opitutaceae bacterium]